MGYLLLSIISSAGILTCFKIASQRGYSKTSIVTINYLVATLIGFLTANKDISYIYSADQQLLLWAMILGVLFISMFFLIDYSVKVSGISVTSIATRLSVVLPIIISLIIDPADKISRVKILAFLFIILSMILISFRNRRGFKSDHKLFVPVMTFFGMGVVDSVVKISQEFYVDDHYLPVFTILVFLICGILGIILLIINRINPFKKPAYCVTGIFLGVFNYASLYFFIKALNLGSKRIFILDSSRIFAFNHISIIVLSLIIGVFFFKERLNRINIIGIMLSVIGVYLLF